MHPLTVHSTTTPVTTLPVTATVTATATATTVKTTTTTTISTSSATATAFRGPACNDPTDSQNGGGCENGCYCDPRTKYPTFGVCNNGIACENACSSDQDCSDDEVCITGPAASTCDSGTTCSPFAGCSTTFGGYKKRDVQRANTRPFRNIVARAGSGMLLPNGAIALQRPDKPETWLSR